MFKKSVDTGLNALMTTLFTLGNQIAVVICTPGNSAANV